MEKGYLRLRLDTLYLSVHKLLTMMIELDTIKKEADKKGIDRDHVHSGS